MGFLKTVSYRKGDYVCFIYYIPTPNIYLEIRRPKF